MDKLKKRELVKVVERIDVDEEAYLMVKNDAIGVTDSIEEVCKFSKEQQKNGEVIKILKGYKRELLSVQQRILLIDEAIDDINAEKLTIPRRYNGYNLVKRKKKEDSNSLNDLI